MRLSSAPGNSRRTQELPPKSTAGKAAPFLFGDQTAGRTIKPVPDKRIVQAWRPSHWDQGVYSIARFELNQGGAGTTLILDHTGFPQGDYDGLSSGWHEHYERGLREISP